MTEPAVAGHVAPSQSPMISASPPVLFGGWGGGSCLHEDNRNVDMPIRHGLVTNVVDPAFGGASAGEVAGSTRVEPKLAMVLGYGFANTVPPPVAFAVVS